MMSYTHFTPEERECLAELYREGRKISEIARLLNRNKSSVSRELKRNKNYLDRYNALGAERKYLSRRKRCRRKEILSEDSKLKTYIIEKLKMFWSPEIILLKWKEEHPDCKLSTSTVYRAIKRKLLPEISAEKHLRRKGKRAGHRKNTATIKPEHTIHEWSEEITKRLRIGDWEGDIVCGGQGKGCLLTMIDRRTRYLVALRIKQRDADTVNEAIKKALKGLPVHSITLDNGPEFAYHQDFSSALETTTYFADPHSPWQRGSNENINDCLRFFFPKGCNFLEITDEEVAFAVNVINNRPRKCLALLSPLDLFQAWC